jgi:hypothetical protein
MWDRRFRLSVPFPPPGTKGELPPSVKGWSFLRNGHLAMLAASRSNGDFYILPEISQKFQQSPDRKTVPPIAHQQGDLRLFNAQRRRRFALSHTPLPDDTEDLQRQSGFHQFLFGVAEAEIREDVGAAFGNAWGLCPGHS